MCRHYRKTTVPLISFYTAAVLFDAAKASDYAVDFNYDPSSSKGPNKWDDVGVRRSEYFDFVSDEGNQCGDKDQSPINVVVKNTCYDDHQFWVNRGANNFDTVEFTVLPHTLRANIPKAADINLATRADFSNLSDKVPAIHVDVKVPSEHHLHGVAYAAEMQITHTHDEDKDSFIIISILMDDSKDLHNPRLEELIREWEETSWERQHRCDNRKNNNNPFYSYKRTYKPRTRQEMIEIWGDPDDVPGKSDWDLYSFLPTPWYCGYKGSLTVPPCKSGVKWRIADLPADISKSQVERMRGLLVNRVNEDCTVGNDVAFEGNVNRPLSLTNNNDVWCCTHENWKPKRHWENYKFPEGYLSWRPPTVAPPPTTRPRTRPPTKRPIRSPVRTRSPTKRHPIMSRRPTFPPTRNPRTPRPQQNTPTFPPQRAPTLRPTLRPTRNPRTPRPQQNTPTFPPQGAPTLRPTRNPRTPRPQQNTPTFPPQGAPTLRPRTV